MVMRGRASSWALLAGVTFFSVTAWAEVDVKRAKEHYSKAESLYRVERFQDAFTEYQEAYLAKPEPNLLFNMAQCQRKMGNRAEAVRFYRRFLAEKPNPPNLAMVEQHLRDLEAVQPPTTLPPPMPIGVAPSPATQAPSTMRKGFTATATARTAAATAPPVSPVSPLAPVAYNQPPPGALAPAGIRPAAVQPVTTPPPVAAPALPPQSLAMAHDPGKSAASSNVLRTDAGPGSDSAADGRPIYKKWWFWAVVGGAVAGAVVIGAVAGHKGDPSCDGLVTCR
ncbi:MAG: hypothetical protein QOI66_1231 [Myxococcales bacterium]|jgi:hypothetical protein|nr:hypothetical protein [Myxococcales bacterium]